METLRLHPHSEESSAQHRATALPHTRRELDAWLYTVLTKGKVPSNGEGDRLLELRAQLDAVVQGEVEMLAFSQRLIAAQYAKLLGWDITEEDDGGREDPRTAWTAYCAHMGIARHW